MLAITVVGIATALTMGAPVIERLRNKAALENVVGQFEEVRAAGNDMYVPDEARYPTVSIPSGRMELGPGTHIMVTANMDPAQPLCDFRVRAWEDWDAALTVTDDGCKEIAASPCPPPAFACLDAFRVDGAVEAPIAVGTTALDPFADYVFRLANDAGTVVYAEARLLHMDRLRWETGDVSATYEGGSILVKEQGVEYLAASPLVSEDPPVGTSCPDQCPYFLRFATMQVRNYTALSGSDSHSVGLVLRGGYIRLDWQEAYLLRMDFHGDLAESWCNAFLLRDALASLEGDFYQQDAADPAHHCTPPSGTTPAPDGIRSVKYIQDPGTVPVDPLPFRFTLSQTVIDASLLI